MGIFTRLFEKNESRSSSGIPDWLAGAGGGVTRAGTTVNEDIALGLTPVWAAVNIISNTIGIFPLHIYRKRPDDNSKEIATRHGLYYVVHNAPNQEITAFDWCKLMATSQLIYGAGISEIEFDGNGNPVALWPIPTNRVTPEKTANGRLIYRVTPESGQVKRLWPEQLLIFREWPKSDGGWLSPIAKHRETLGSALADKEFGARMFGQGVNPAGVVTGLKKGAIEAASQARNNRFEAYRGLGESHRLMLLEEGEKFERVSLPPEDAQYLETRKFDISEIARIFGVPLFLMQDHEKSTSWGSGIAETKDAFVTFTMLSHCKRWEDEINKKLLDGGKKYYCKFTIEGLLRGSLKDRMESYTKGAALGIYSIDEMREMEDMNPLENGLGMTRLVSTNTKLLEDVIRESKNAEAENE
jgi:HK97 family phage portal protein